MIRRTLAHMRGNAVAWVALFVALGGTGAYAANTIGSDDIIDDSIQSQDVRDWSFQNNEGQVGFVGGLRSSDIAPGHVTALQLQKDSVTQAKIANDAVGKFEIKTGAVTGAEIKNRSISEDELEKRSVGGNELDYGRIRSATKQGFDRNYVIESARCFSGERLQYGGARVRTDEEEVGLRASRPIIEKVDGVQQGVGWIASTNRHRGVAGDLDKVWLTVWAICVPL